MTTRRHPSQIAMRSALAEQPDLMMLCTYHSDELVQTFGADRMLRMPIAESAMLGMATGIALTGRRAVVNIARAAFLFSAMDPLVNQATKWRYFTGGQFSAPLLVRGLTMGEEHLGAQHEHAPHSALAHVPGLVVAVPGSPNSAGGLLATGLRHPDPVVFLESPVLYGADWPELPEWEADHAPLPFGRAGLARPGTDVSLVGIGNTVRTCWYAAEILAARGVSAQVVDLRTAAPLDRAGVAAMVAGTGAAVLVDESPETGGLMADLGLHLVTGGALAPDRLRVVGGRGTPMPFSPVLRRELLPSPSGVAEEAARLAAPALDRTGATP